MFYKTLAAAAMTVALTTGAMAQAVQNPSAAADGNAGQTPQTSGEVQGGGMENMTFTSDAERMMFEENWDMMTRFFADDTMTTLRAQEEIGTAFSGLTPEEQQALRDDCTNVTGDTSNSYGKSVVDLCTTVGGM